jgi:hypothetical protein
MRVRLDGHPPFNLLRPACGNTEHDVDGVMRRPSVLRRYGRLTCPSGSIYSCTNRALDTTTPAGKAMFQMLGVFAEFERAMIKERVRAGLARAKAAGTKLGRPSLPQAKEAAIRAALSQPGRPGVRKIAAQFGVDPSTVQRISRSAAMTVR